MQLHHLANPERNAQFALLTDWADADTAHAESDHALLDSVTQQVRELNARYPRPADPLRADALQNDTGASPATAPPRFIVLHRQRRFSETEQRWIGWERKRGKLELLVAALAEGTSDAFLDLGEESRMWSDTR